MVLATVYGDVHDIGKSLVNTILSNNGYTVHDLGKQVPVNTIIDKAVEVKADAIGLSALLVTTSKQMPLCVQELDGAACSLPVLIGGAAINRAFGRRAPCCPMARRTSPACSTARTRSRAWRRWMTLTDAHADDRLVAQVRAEIEAERDRVEASAGGARDAAPGAGPRRDVKMPEPPFWGARRIEADLRRGLAAPRSEHAVSPSLGRPSGQGRRVRPHHPRDLRARAGLVDAKTRCAKAGYSH